MHELGITRNIVAIVEEAAKGRRVLRVTLDVGDFSGVLADSIAFCFDIAAKGTALDGATLQIRRIAGRARCESCGAEFATATLYEACACGCARLRRLEGEELKIREMELEDG